jgi:hypothetical protein
MWMVYADTAFLRKLERNDLCLLATIPRHRCGQRVANPTPETPYSPTPMP